MNTPNWLTTTIVLGMLTAPLLGVSLRIGLRLWYGARGPEPGDAVHSLVNVLAWLMIGVGVVAWSLTTTVGVVFLAFVIGAALLDYVSARRDLQRSLAWSIVTDAQHRDRDVAEMVRLQSDRFTGVVRGDLQGFAWQLDHGDSLPTAVGIWHKAFPRAAQGYAALGKADGRLAVDREPAYLVPNTDVTANYSYLAWVLFSLILFTGGVVTYIAPAFQQIFLDFEIDLPGATSSFLGFSSWFTDTPAGAVVILVATGALALMALTLLCNLLDVPLWRGLGDRLFYARRRAQVLRLLAIAVQRRTPMTRALNDLAIGHPRFPTRRGARQLQRAFRLAADGADWKDALLKAGLVRRNELGLLQTAEQAGNLPWAMRALADRLTARSWFRWQALQQVAYPAAVAAIGVLVLWYCVAMFLPLVNLIGALG